MLRFAALRGRLDPRRAPRRFRTPGRARGNSGAREIWPSPQRRGEGRRGCRRGGRERYACGRVRSKRRPRAVPRPRVVAGLDAAAEDVVEEETFRFNPFSARFAAFRRGVRAVRRPEAGADALRAFEEEEGKKKRRSEGDSRRTQRERRLAYACASSASARRRRRGSARRARGVRGAAAADNRRACARARPAAARGSRRRRAAHQAAGGGTEASTRWTTGGRTPPRARSAGVAAARAAAVAPAGPGSDAPPPGVKTARL